MLFNELLAKLNTDLKNEWRHLRFYLYHAGAVTGLHAHELKEFLQESAKGEMEHVGQFIDMIIGLGGEATTESLDFPKLSDPRDILQFAGTIEAEVVKNYVERIAQLDTLTDDNDQILIDKKWLEIFLEKQIEDSRQDLDHLRQLLKRF
jgi:bacterioferritin (cytochrome b1)